MARGYTLIELLLALAIVGILTAIAWPSYSAIMHRAQRNDARFALLQLQQLQERHYLTHLRYADAIGNTDNEVTLVAPDRSQNGHYLLSLSAADDGQAFAAVAQVRGGGPQARDRHCQRLEVDQVGRRRSADATGVWTEADPHRCWG